MSNSKNEWIYDVKEATKWTRGKFPHSHFGLTSPDQFHPEWVYAVVATDFTAMATVIPKEVPKSEWQLRTGTNPTLKTPHEFWALPRERFQIYQLSTGARPIK